MNDPTRRAMRSLDGLSVGDAFGELFFFLSPECAGWEDLPAEKMALDRRYPHGAVHR